MVTYGCLKKVHLIVHFLNVYCCNIYLPQVSAFAYLIVIYTIHYFIFHFKCYSILHFAVCQLLRWAFLFSESERFNCTQVFLNNSPAPCSLYFYR